MLSHLRTVLLATAVLAALGAIHTHSTAIARPVTVQTTPHTGPLPSALASGLVGASVGSVAIGF